MKTLPELQLSVKNATEELYNLLRVIKPTWSSDQIELKKLSGGFSCLMYMCFNKEDPTDGVTVRARTNGFQDFPHVRESAVEAKILNTLHNFGLFPKVLATFQNGYCYTYIAGTPLYSFMNMAFSIREATLRLVARKLAEINSVTIEGCDYTTTSYFKNLFLLLEEKYPVGDKLPKDTPTREEIERELKMVEERAIQMDSPLVLCHGDPHPGNVVYNQEKGIVTYVDWEMSHVGYQAADVGYALQIFKMLGSNPAMKMDIPENIERKYVRFYLEKWFELHGKKESDVTEEDVDKLELQASVFRLSAQLFWVILLSAQFAQSGMPDHVDTEALNKAAAQRAKENAEVANSPPVEQAPIEDQTAQMVHGIYASYLSMRDDILN